MMVYSIFILGIPLKNTLVERLYRLTSFLILVVLVLILENHIIIWIFCREINDRIYFTIVKIYMNGTDAPFLKALPFDPLNKDFFFTFKIYFILCIFFFIFFNNVTLKFPEGSQSPLNSQFFVQVPIKFWERHPPPGPLYLLSENKIYGDWFFKSKIASSYDPSMYTLYMVLYRYMMSAVQPVDNNKRKNWIW